MEVEFQGVSSQTGKVKITRKGVSLHSDDASACMIAVSMSSGSYSGFAMYDMVQRKWKEFNTAPKTTSFGNTEQ